ncbi:hypothetical protein D3C74_379550 [compost metagenome]
MHFGAYLAHRASGEAGSHQGDAVRLVRLQHGEDLAIVQMELSNPIAVLNPCAILALHAFSAIFGDEHFADAELSGVVGAHSAEQIEHSLPAHPNSLDDLLDYRLGLHRYPSFLYRM